MMKRTSYVVALLAVSLLLLTAGCYTVLRHPTGSVVAHEGSQYRTCADCHADAAYYHPYSRPYYGHGRSQYGSQYGWSGYYGSPWWYNDHWWWDPYDDHDYDHDYDGPEVETGTRHLWSSDGWASGGWGFTKPGGSVRRSTPPPAPPRNDDGQKEEDNKKKDEKKEETRDLWKKPKKGF